MAGAGSVRPPLPAPLHSIQGINRNFRNNFVLMLKISPTQNLSIQTKRFQMPLFFVTR